MAYYIKTNRAGKTIKIRIIKPESKVIASPPLPPLSEVQTRQLTEAVAAYLHNNTIALSEIGTVTSAIRIALFGR